MTTINATPLQDLFNDSDIPTAKAETILTQAIDLLNTFGAGISAMTGAVGSKTLAATSAESGTIMTMAREVYSVMYKNADDSSSGSIGSLSASYSSNNRLLDFAEKLAAKLKTTTITDDPPIFVYNDPVV